MELNIIFTRIDGIIRFLFYVFIFWLPYSSAVVETAVILALLLWIVKRLILVDFKNLGTLPFQARAANIIQAFRPEKSYLDKPIFLFLLICGFSIAGSSFFEMALTGFLRKTAEWFVIYFLVIEVFTERKHITAALGVFLLTSLAVCADGLIQYYVTHKDIFCGRTISREGATAAFKHPNSLGAYLTILIPLLLSLQFQLWPRSKARSALPAQRPVREIFEEFFTNRWGRGFLVLFLTMALWVTVITFSRAAWMGICLGVYAMLLTLKKMRVFTLVIVVLGLGCYLLLPNNFRHAVRLDAQDVYGAFEWRKNLWLDSLTMIKERPLLGHGLNTYMNLFQDYRRKFLNNFDFSPTYAHNCYIQMACEIGILGLFGFLWILGRLLINSLRVFKVNHQDEHMFFKLLMLGVLAGGAAFCIHSFFDANFYSLQLSSLFWFMVGILVSSYNVLHRSPIYVKK